MALASLAVRLLSLSAAPSVLFWQPALDARSHMLGPAEMMRLWLAEDLDAVEDDDFPVHPGDECPCGCTGHRALCGY